MIRMKDECEEARVKIAERIKNGDRRLDRAIGCMLGGASGDALGYPVEFMYYEEIKKRYGANGIRNYELTSGKAQISDDTQMSIFTATGILTAIACEAMDNGIIFGTKWIEFASVNPVRNATIYRFKTKTSTRRDMCVLPIRIGWSRKAK